MEEIVIVWNNVETPQEAGFKQFKEWKRPVHFHKTPQNSMDFRFSLPPESKAKVFFSIDDDIVLDCQELIQGFKQWRKYAIGDVSPLMGYGQRQFELDSLHSRYYSNNPRNSNPYFQFTLVGLTWISRHYLELYNANKLYELR